MEQIKKIIGRHQYHVLKNIPFDKLSEENKQAVTDFEQGNKTEEQVQALQVYQESLKREEKSKKEVVFSVNQLKKKFNREWFKQEKKPFDTSNLDSIENLKALTYYFAKDEKFFQCKNLRTEFKYGDSIKRSKPSFEKGLLVIGNFGNGKTSMMRTFKNMFRGKKGWYFKEYNANDLVDEYEGCSTPELKREFWNKMNRERISFDDVKTERMASNYGKSNIFKDIIEKRYNQHLFNTYITCNFLDGKANDIEAGLLEFGSKYGSRVFDRLFEMFNIIEFKGKSFRQ